jgi:hypothetical protein
VGSVTPVVPTKGGSVTVTGTVTNEGKQTVTGAHVGVRIAPGGPLSSRSAIADVSAHAGYTYADGEEVRGHTTAVPDLPAGISRPFTLNVPVSDLKLTTSGVYQLGVSLTRQTPGTGYSQVLGIDRTFLPWYRSGDSKRTRFTFLWPLIDRPHLAVRSDTDAQQSPIFLDDDLAKELAPGGRLQQMVALGRSLPITWVVDPDLLATVDAMTRSYRVAGAGGDLDQTTAGTGTQQAKQWLYDLQQAVTGHEVVALPFSDPDIASIAHRGKNVAGTLAYLHDATQLASSTVDTVLHVPSTTDVAWPVEGAVDPSVVAVATSAGADKVIARSDSLRESGMNYTPTAARPIGGGTTAVVADATLSKAFQGGMLRADAEYAAVQEFVSQTLTIALQAPEKQRSVVVAPQRMPTASQAQAMAEAITSVQHSGWARSATFTTAAKATPDPRSNRKVPGGGSYPGSLRKHELTTGAFQELQDTQRNLQGFRQILSHPEKVDTPFGSALLRAMSNEWRDDASGSAENFRDAIATYLSELTQLVRILGKGGTLTLSGRSATIPVTVKNELGQTITGLELRLTSSQSNSLGVSQPQTVTVEGGHTRSLKFTANASRNGFTWVTAQLYTKDGAKYGDPMTFKVNVTSITSTIMLVIACGLLLLVLAGVRMYRQRKRKAAATQSGADGDDGDGGDGDGGGSDGEGGGDPKAGQPSEQPGDPAADTEAESTAPSTTGEKVDR